jgi:DNA-directed RNA polymerase II subunit RPB1
MSVAKIEYPETMDETRQRPRIGGLNDPRLGSIDRNFKCQTVSFTFIVLTNVVLS